jgi:hypothetical protein
LHFPLPTVAKRQWRSAAGGFDSQCCATSDRSDDGHLPTGADLRDIVTGRCTIWSAARGRELTIGGRELDADQALAHLVSEVVPPEALTAATQATMADRRARDDLPMRAKASPPPRRRAPRHRHPRALALSPSPPPRLHELVRLSSS